MNILLVSGPGISLKEPYDSGIESFIVSFANQLIAEGHKVDIVAEKAELNSKFNLINPFTRSTADETNFLRQLTEKIQFKTINFNQYDVVHYNMFYPHLIKTGCELKNKSFLTLHSPADNKRVAAYKELSLNNNLQFIAISGRVKNEWDKALDLNIPLIHNGIDINLWPTNASRKPEYLLWSARINDEKNVAAAIRVAQEMKLPLKIAGRIADQPYFDDQVKPHLNEQIEYVGHVTQSELNNLAKKAMAYLATATWQEPFGLAALEMLASGLPVVGFNTAVPQGWSHESVLTTASLRWQDLIALIKKSRTISPYKCREFAAGMTVQKMTLDYLNLYQHILSQENLLDPIKFKDDNSVQIFDEKLQSLN
ncbi:glycosyltransferase [Halpernia frigidisoli]|uniref:Glycosyltransferase involved in cell wall bisynthesis n=1 Tax=Halpernia frigidisoli TaxID=1125876 RepID=A0A1I3DMI6_9FLAO|nr:glycosyltransferase [Halpernia frigidisoli]SFH87701.1 Glycosyltransferase involved in cell wall bisynthesis [Halpernia frigidisoli]